MKKIFTLLSVTFILYICTADSIIAQAVSPQDSLALVDLYNSTNGSKWTEHTNWLTKKPVSKWSGITVKNSRVVSIALVGNNLNGTIPSSLGDITELTGLYLFANHLSGSIPLSFSNLTKLFALNLSSNQLTGNIPASLGNLANLVYLYLSSNQLSGNIPSEIGNPTLLNILDLSGNQLSGSIPFSLTHLASLNYFYLDHNQLSGSIPAEIGNLSSIYLLSFSYNQLSGSIPSTFGNLVNLEELYLNNNQLSGSIPSELGNLNNNIYSLDLSNNHLTGSIPTELGTFSFTFHDLNLSNNLLTGSIPSSFGNLTNLGSLLLSNNLLSGSIPRELSSLSYELSYLDLRNNQLTGGIPSSFGSLQTLVYLFLDHNQLNDIPSSIFNLRYLDSFTLSYNSFTFNGLEQVAQTFPNAQYDHQALIPVSRNDSALFVSAGGALSNNTYNWYRVTKTGYSRVATWRGDSVFYPARNGVYVARIVNSIATQLVLYSDPIQYTLSAANDNVIATSKNISHVIDKTNAFVVYPNPVKNILHVQTNSNASISLIDQTGKILLTQNINGTSDINVSGMVAGLYYVKNNSNGIVRKVIITK